MPLRLIARPQRIPAFAVNVSRPWKLNFQQVRLASSKKSPILNDLNDPKPPIYKHDHNDVIKPPGLRVIDYLDSEVRAKIVKRQSSKVRPRLDKRSRDPLEALTVFAMRVQAYRDGTAELEEVRALGQRLFPSLSKTQAKILEHDIESYHLDEDPKSHRRSIIKKKLFFRDYKYTLPHLAKWVRCIQAATITEAIESMRYHSRIWPSFLVGFTFKRACESRAEAILLFQLFQKQFCKQPPRIQVQMFIRLVERLHNTLIDLIPHACEIFIKDSKDGIPGSVYNQLLWHISGIRSPRRSVREYKLLTEAQKVIVSRMVKRGLTVDARGLLALCFAFRDVSAERSRHFFNAVHLRTLQTNGHTYNENDEMLKMPPKELISCMEILLSENIMHITDRAVNFDPEHYSPMVVGTCLFRLVELGALNSDTCHTVWSKVKKSQLSLTPFLMYQLLRGGSPRRQQLLMIKEAIAKFGLTPNENVMTKIIQLEPDLTFTRMLLSSLEKKTRATFNVLLRHEAYFDPEKVWTTYLEMQEEGIEPTDSTLESLIISALDTDLRWDGLYACQRVVVEFKRWVRGANNDGSDINSLAKIYPTDELVHNYVRLLVKAKYDQELLEVLPWMERLNLKPSKNILCALILHSPNGEFLKKHGQKIGGWPTEMEIQTYKFHTQRPSAPTVPIEYEEMYN